MISKARQASKATAMTAFIGPAPVQQTETLTIGEHSDDYHADRSSVSKSMLAVFRESRQEYYHQFITGQMPGKFATKGMNLGHIVHSILLEDKPLESVCTQYPDDCLKSDGSLNGKRTAVFRDENSDLICVKDIAPIEAVVEAVMDSDLYAIVQESTGRERRIDWIDKDSGLPCRTKPDFFCDIGEKVVCYDLKVTPQVTPDSFRRSASRFCYWLQDAHYSAGLQAEFGKPVEFRFWLIEPTFPFRIVPRYYTGLSRETAKNAHKQIVYELATCYRHDDWREAWPEEMVLNQWDVDDGNTEVELEGFDDE